jgi:hypothetical protein
MHWAERFVGIQYEEMNCAEFVEHVLREQFQINFKFPQSRGSLFAETQQIKENLSVFTERTESPKDGDLVLMHGKRLMCHVGLYVKIGMTAYVLHSEGRVKTSALHRMKDIIQYGYSVAGFYKWRK